MSWLTYSVKYRTIMVLWDVTCICLQDRRTLPWRWRQPFLKKHWCLSSKLCGTSQKTNLSIHCHENLHSLAQKSVTSFKCGICL
jgi:hypothetical protein